MFLAQMPRDHDLALGGHDCCRHSSSYLIGKMATRFRRRRCENVALRAVVSGAVCEKEHGGTRTSIQDCAEASASVDSADG